MVLGLISGGDYALRHAVENIEDSREDAVNDLKGINFSDNDILVVIAASGRTPYVLAGLEYANSIGARTACITTSENSPVAATAKFPIEAITGPETLTGSTRMKSGTAQKIIMEVTDVDKETAKKYLEKYDSVKHAIFAIMSNIEEINEIEKILNNNKGNIRKSIQSIKWGNLHGRFNC